MHLKMITTSPQATFPSHISYLVPYSYSQAIKKDWTYYTVHPLLLKLSLLILPFLQTVQRIFLSYALK